MAQRGLWVVTAINSTVALKDLVQTARIASPSVKMGPPRVLPPVLLRKIVDRVTRVRKWVPACLVVWTMTLAPTARFAGKTAPALSLRVRLIPVLKEPSAVIRVVVSSTSAMFQQALYPIATVL